MGSSCHGLTAQPAWGPVASPNAHHAASELHEQVYRSLPRLSKWIGFCISGRRRRPYLCPTRNFHGRFRPAGSDIPRSLPAASSCGPIDITFYRRSLDYLKRCDELKAAILRRWRGLQGRSGGAPQYSRQCRESWLILITRLRCESSTRYGETDTVSRGGERRRWSHPNSSLSVWILACHEMTLGQLVFD